MYTLDNLLWENKMAFGVRKTDVDIPAGTEFYVCAYCKEVFVKKKDYKAHLKTHADEV